jgi:hypothetical protein
MLRDMRIRAAVVGAVLVAVTACSGDDERPEPRPITRPESRPPSLPNVDDPGAVMMLTSPHPDALVWITSTGTIEVGKTGSGWSGDLEPKDPIVIGPGQDLRRAVLGAIVAGHGPGAIDAQRELDELQRPDPAQARRQAIDQARAAGILGTTVSADPEVPLSGRLPGSAGRALDTIDHTIPFVLAAPDAPSPRLVSALRASGGLIGVVQHRKLGALTIVFAREPTTSADPGQNQWLEAYTDAQGVHLVVMPGGAETVVPRRSGAIDGPGLLTAYDQVRGVVANHDRQLDVIANNATSVQAFVELVAALHTLGIRTLAVAEGPDTVSERLAQLAQVSQRGMIYGGRGTPSVSIGQPNAQGDLDKAIIRRYVKRNIQKVQYCYEKQLLGSPALSGTLMVQFFIRPDGKVGSATGSGVDPEVAACVVKVIESIEFPKPQGGGGVQVNYPFTFRPAGP